MYKEKLLTKINEIFEVLKEKSHSIILKQISIEDKSQQTVEMLSYEIQNITYSILIELYSNISKKILNESEFIHGENKLRFYESDIKKDIFEKYRFNLESLKALKKGIEYKELNREYTALATAAGTAAIGGVLKYNFNDDIKIPTVGILAVALLAFTGAYFKVVPSKNEDRLIDAIDKFLSEIKSELIDWIDEVENYFNSRVEELVKTF